MSQLTKTHVSFRLSEALAKRLRAAVRHLRGAPLFLTLDGVAEGALDDAVSRIEKKHNAGKRYQDVEGSGQ